jgi:hypothetical protein
MKKTCFLLLCLLANFMGVKAQVGYQISLLNTATGVPRSNETVTVSVSLSNNANEVFYSETKSATTNDFGVLSLTIGNADTFKEVDLSKMPFFIEVTANGVMIGKSQMLSVPVAEVAKRVAPIKIEDVVGVWGCQEPYAKKLFSFDKDGNFVYKYVSDRDVSTDTGTFFIDGNYIFLLWRTDYGIKSESYLVKEGKLYPKGSLIFTKQ